MRLKNFCCLLEHWNSDLLYPALCLYPMLSIAEKKKPLLQKCKSIGRDNRKILGYSRLMSRFRCPAEVTRDGSVRYHAPEALGTVGKRSTTYYRLESCSLSCLPLKIRSWKRLRYLIAPQSIRVRSFSYATNSTFYSSFNDCSFLLTFFTARYWFAPSRSFTHEVVCFFSHVATKNVKQFLS